MKDDSLNYEYNLEKEASAIYSCICLEKNNELMTFAIYNEIFKKIILLCDEEYIASICNKELTKELLRYINGLTCFNKTLNSETFIKEFLNIINKNAVLYEIMDMDVSPIINNLISNLPNIIEDLYWVNDINKKELSFTDKTNIVITTLDLFDNSKNFLKDVNGEEKTKKIYNELKNIIIFFNKCMCFGDFSFERHKNTAKKLVKEVIRDAIIEKKLDLNNIENEPLRLIYEYFDDNGKIILSSLMPYIVSDINIDDDSYPDITKEIEEQLCLSKKETKKVMSKFWKDYKKVHAIFNDEKENNKQKKKVKK